MTEDHIYLFCKITTYLPNMHNKMIFRIREKKFNRNQPSKQIQNYISVNKSLYNKKVAHPSLWLCWNSTSYRTWSLLSSLRKINEMSKNYQNESIHISLFDFHKDFRRWHSCTPAAVFFDISRRLIDLARIPADNRYE